MRLIYALVVAALSFGTMLAQDGRAENIVDRLKSIMSTQAAHPAQGQSALSRSDNETLAPSSDRLCDSLDHSYTLTENVTELMVNELRCKVMKCQPSEIIPKNNAKLEPWLRNYSTKHVWLPAPLENEIGATLVSKMQAQGMILDRGLPNTEKLYTRIDLALEAAKKSYPNVPYELKIFIIDITDQVNAQATPGGNIIITKAAAKDLDDDALELVLGHEVAHLAKRHMSKQLQQRLMETADGVEVFKRMTTLKTDSKQQTNAATQIIDRLRCSFAKYDQDQESQADACAARVMIEAGRDPIAAWDDYVRTRGSVTTSKLKVQNAAGATCYTSLEAHPKDRDRANNIRFATAHHRMRAQR